MAGHPEIASALRGAIAAFARTIKGG